MRVRSELQLQVSVSLCSVLQEMNQIVSVSLCSVLQEMNQIDKCQYFLRSTQNESNFHIFSHSSLIKLLLGLLLATM